MELSKMKLTFIILQYNTPNETMECINSIYKNMPLTNDWSIVIVENGSHLADYYRLKFEYKLDKRIKVVRIDNNSSFFQA
jgi:GT2 family glycosyltransferase